MKTSTLLVILALLLGFINASFLPSGKSWITTDRFTSEGRNPSNHLNFFCRDCCHDTLPYLNKKIWSHTPAELAYHLGEPSIANGKVYSSNRDGTIRSIDLVTGQTYFAFNYSDYVGNPVVPGEWSAAAGYGILSPTAHSRTTPLLVYQKWYEEVPDKAVILSTGIGINTMSVFDPNYEGPGAPPLFCQVKLTDDPAVQFAGSPKFSWVDGRRVAFFGSSSRGEFYLISQGIQPTSKGTMYAVDIDTCEVIWETMTVANRTDYGGGSIVPGPAVDEFEDVIYGVTQNLYIAEQPVLDCLSAGNADCSHLVAPGTYPDSLISFDKKTGVILGVYSDNGPSNPDIYNVACSIEGLEFLCFDYSGDDGGSILQPFMVWQNDFSQGIFGWFRAVVVAFKRGTIAILKSKTLEFITTFIIGPGSDQGGGPAFNCGYIRAKNHAVCSANNPEGKPFVTIHGVNTTKDILTLIDFNTNTIIDQQPIDIRAFPGCSILNNRFAVCPNRNNPNEARLIFYDIYDNFKIVGRAGNGTAGTPPIIVEDRIVISGGYIFSEGFNTNNDLEAYGFDYDNMPSGTSCH